METTNLMSKECSTPSKYTGLGAALAAELMTGFCFGIGVILAIGVVDGFNICVGTLVSSGNK